MRPSRALPVVTFLLLFSYGFPLHSLAQQPPELDQGLKPYGAYQHGDVDSVSLTSGNVNVHIPLFSLPQRGGKLRMNFEVVYNNKSWSQAQTGSSHFWQFGGGVVSVVSDQGAVEKNSIITTTDLSGATVKFHHYSIVTADGSSPRGRHNF